MKKQLLKRSVNNVTFLADMKFQCLNLIVDYFVQRLNITADVVLLCTDVLKNLTGCYEFGI